MARTMKGIVTIDPACDRPPAVLIAIPILLAHDFDIHHVVRGRDEASFD
jgi:hypothetical protein